VYRFFTDLEQPNKMDEKPFLEFNLLDFKEQDVEELKKFAKVTFDVDEILATANELKYTRAIQNLLADWMENPSEDFVRCVTSDLLNGRRFTPAVKDQFTQITKRAFKQLIGSRINERLRVAMTPDVPAAKETVQEPTVAEAESEAASVETTLHEIEGFHIVRAILRDLVPTRRVFMRDAQSYCAVLFDDNNRKPICRLRFNNPERLVLGLMNGKDEEKVVLADLDELYNYADRIKSAAGAYM
jgi:hypothetical protein